MKEVRDRYSQPKLFGEPSVERIATAPESPTSASFFHLFHGGSLKVIGQIMKRILAADAPTPWAFF